MHIHKILVFGLSCYLFPLFSQSVVDSLIFFHQKEISRYEYQVNDSSLVFYMSYASADIINKQAWEKAIPTHIPYEIDVVFTQYPKKKEDWRTNYNALLAKRIQNIRSLHPLLRSDGIIWNIIIQTDCQSEPEAMRMFHGVVIRTHPVPIIPEWQPETITKEETTSDSPPITMTSLVLTPDEIDDVLTGEVVLLDSGIYDIFHRNPEWKNMLIVMDWTASMYIYGAQLLLWHQLNLKTDPWSVKHFVLFNDGNRGKNKPIGNTGGIYYAKATSIEGILAEMKVCARNGDGGDVEENDIEALYKGMQLSDYDEVILIADNSPVRDMDLLTKLNHPVRVVICSPSWEPVNPQYYEIAKATGGSIHTIQEDLDFMKEMNR